MSEVSWEPTLLALASREPLADQIDALFLHQRKNFPAYRAGVDALASIRSKTLALDEAHIVVQANPGRQKSTHARVDPLSVAQRPCFLCAQNIPAEERGIAFDDLVVLPNPFPVLGRHCTIPAREHSPQLLGQRIPDLLKLAKALAPGMLVFYNGARCGASAPDHFHFQACDQVKVPLLSRLPLSGRRDEIVPFTSFGRKMVVSGLQDPRKAREHILRTLEILSTFESSDAEPMINVVALYRDGRYVTILFPRAKHRPDCYFKSGKAQIAISPAALEMAGVLVVAQADHFDRVDSQTAATIYAEVSLDEGRFTSLSEALI